MTEKLKRLFRVKKTECEMMLTRGYDITNVSVSKEEDWITFDLNRIMKISFEEFLALSKEENIFKNRKGFSSLYGEILVIYLPMIKTGETITKFLNLGIVHLILITEVELSSANWKIIRSDTSGTKVEVFKDIELAFNRTKHCYSPITITYIKNEEVINWSKKEEVQAEKLPLMVHLDTVAKWYGASPKDVFQMTVMGCGTDTAIFSRCVRQTPK